MKQRIIKAVVLACLLLAVGTGVYSQKAEALTKTQVKAKVSSLDKGIKKLQKEKRKALAAEKKQKKGTKELFGTVISHNPFVMKNTLDGSYYWIENSGNMGTMVTITAGYVKLTGKYRDYNGITCRVAKAAKISHKSASLERKIKKKQKNLKNYQNSLKETIVFTKNSTEVMVGSPKKLPWHWKYSGKYNTAKWKSSDTSIATVDSDGNVTGKKTGTVTVSATTSLSQKTAQCKVAVSKAQLRVSYFRVDEDAGDEPEEVELAEGGTIHSDVLGEKYSLGFMFGSEEIEEADEYSSSDESVATITSYGWVETVGVGESTITVSYSGISFSFKIVVDTPIALYYIGDDTYTPIQNNTVFTLGTGKRLYFCAGGYKAASGFYGAVRCESSDESVAYVTPTFGMVDDEGFIRAVAPGTATITVECCNLVLSFKVTVEDAAGSDNGYDDGGYDDGDSGGDDDWYDDGWYDDSYDE